MIENVKKVDVGNFQKVNSRNNQTSSMNKISNTDLEVYEFSSSTGNDMTKNSFKWNSDGTKCSIEFYDGSTGECTIHRDSDGNFLYAILKMTNKDGSTTEYFYSEDTKVTTITAYTDDNKEVSVEVYEDESGTVYSVSPEAAKILNLDVPEEYETASGEKKEIQSYHFYSDGTYSITYKNGENSTSQTLPDEKCGNASRLFDAVDYESIYLDLSLIELEKKGIK